MAQRSEPISPPDVKDLERLRAEMAQRSEPISPPEVKDLE